MLQSLSADLVLQAKQPQHTTLCTTSSQNSLASYGYAVVQYNLNALITVDVQEQKYLAPIKAALVAANAAAGGSLYGALDFEKQAVAGHSRGGKLAALHLAAVRSGCMRALGGCVNSESSGPGKGGRFVQTTAARQRNTQRTTTNHPNVRSQRTPTCRTPPPSPPPS